MGGLAIREAISTRIHMSTYKFLPVFDQYSINRTWSIILLY